MFLVSQSGFELIVTKETWSLGYYCRVDQLKVDSGIILPGRPAKSGVCDNTVSNYSC